MSVSVRPSVCQSIPELSMGWVDSWVGLGWVGSVGSTPSVRDHISRTTKFAVSVVRFSCVSVAISYVLPVLWTPS